MEKLVTFIFVSTLVGAVCAKNCIENKGEKKCEKGTSASSCDAGETCLYLAQGQSGAFDGVCGPPQAEGCDCDPSLLSGETCESGLTCQSTKCSKNGCKYECGQPSGEDQLLQCRGGNQWRKVYSHDPYGEREDGNLTELIELVRAGADIKVQSHFGVHRVEKVSISTIETAVYAQINFLMLYFIPNAPAFSMYLVTSTTGNHHVTSLRPGHGEEENEALHLPYNNQEWLRDLTWFARESNIELADGNAMTTSFRDGATGSVFWDNALRQLDAMSVEDGTMCGQNLWEIKDTLSGREFYPIDSWHFSEMCSDGSMEGKYVLMNTDSVNDTISNDITGATWFADTCWNYVYRHDADGNALSGSLDALVEKARSGKPLVVKIEGVYHKVSKVVVAADGSSVLAQVYDQFQDGLTPPTLIWLDVSTDGSVKEVTVVVGLEDSVVVTPLSREVTWFADGRSWDLLYRTDDSGAAVSGSTNDVFTANNGGADIRVGISRAGGSLEIYQPDIVGTFPLSTTLIAYVDREIAIDDDDQVFQMRSFFVMHGFVRQKKYQAEGQHVADVPSEVVDMSWWANGFE